MALRNAAGTVLTRAQVDALKSTVPADPVVEFSQDIYVDAEFEGGGSRRGEELLFKAGERYRQSELDAVYPNPAVTSVTPAGGAAAGGTAVVIAGSGFDAGEVLVGPGGGDLSAGAVTVTFGGAAATSVSVADDGEITCVSPAHAAGAVDVVVVTAAGSATSAGSFTYA